MPEGSGKSNEELSSIRRIAVLGVDSLTQKAVVVVREGERLVPNPLGCIGRVARAAFSGTVEQPDARSQGSAESELPPDTTA